MSRYHVSVDIGGTFTDFVVYDEEKEYAFTGKVLSTPDDPARGVITGLTDLIGNLGQIAFLVHGTTIGLNAFLERRGARVLLVTTAGFHDVYTIARGDRKKLYALQYRKPEPLIPPRDIHAVRERVRWDGSVQEELSCEDFEPVIEKIRTEGIKAVAICFLHAYVNPEHELQARKLLVGARVVGAELASARGEGYLSPRQGTLAVALPGLSISLSHEIAREWREDAYKTRYGHSTPGAPIEFVNLRVAAFGKLERHTAGFRPAKGDQSYDTGTRDVIFQGQAVPTQFYRRDRLPIGITLAGPHVIEEETATAVVPPGWVSRVDELGNIIITRKES